jgi:5-methylcytosine-specific restriction endonuclease McrA
MSRYTAGRCRCDECRLVNREYQRKYREANREKVREASRKYIANNREIARARTAQWRLNNPGASALQSKRWRDANREHAISKSRAWNMEHPDQVRAAAAKWRATPERRAAAAKRAHVWRQNNPGAALVANRRWRDANRQAVRLMAERRRARKTTSSANVSVRDWNRLVSRYRNGCAYCGDTTAPLTQDHVVPLSRGGRHSIGNMLPACQPCNSSKGSRLLIQWRRMRLP